MKRRYGRGWGYLYSWFLDGIALARSLGADIGWMQKGVRVWYFGGVSSGGVTSSDAEEAYLIESIEGTDVRMTHHAAQNWWETDADRKRYLSPP